MLLLGHSNVLLWLKSLLQGGPLFRGQTNLTDVLARIVNGHPNRDIDALLPWAYLKQDLRAVA
jgi:hypothetical protein